MSIGILPPFLELRTSPNSRLKRALAITAVLLLYIVIGAFWHFRIKPDLLAKRSRYDQIWQIEEGIIRFTTKHQRLPQSLEELVDGKYLPPVSSIYACALKYGSHSPPPIAFHASDYLLVSRTNTAMIYPRPEIMEIIARRYRFASITSNRLTCVVWSGTRLYEVAPQ